MSEQKQERSRIIFDSDGWAYTVLAVSRDGVIGFRWLHAGGSYRVRVVALTTSSAEVIGSVLTDEDKWFKSSNEGGYNRFSKRVAEKELAQTLTTALIAIGFWSDPDSWVNTEAPARRRSLTFDPIVDDGHRFSTSAFPIDGKTGKCVDNGIAAKEFSLNDKSTWSRNTTAALAETAEVATDAMIANTLG